MSFKAYLSILMNKIYNDEDYLAPIIEIYKHFFHAKNAKKRKIIGTLKERQNHIRPGLYSEIWVDLYTENDFFLNFRMKRLTFHHLLEVIMRQQQMQRVNNLYHNL